MIKKMECALKTIYSWLTERPMNDMHHVHENKLGKFWESEINKQMNNI